MNPSAHSERTPRETLLSSTYLQNKWWWWGPPKTRNGERAGEKTAARYGLAPYSGSGVPFGAAQLWAKRQPRGAMAVLLINHGSKRLESHSVDLASKLNLTAPSYAARDVWAHADLGTVAGKLSLSVDAYDSAFVVLTPQSKAVP